MVLILTLATPVYADDFQDAIDAYEREDYELALQKFKPLAEQEYANAQLWVGLMYGRGAWCGGGLCDSYEVDPESRSKGVCESPV